MTTEENVTTHSNTRPDGGDDWGVWQWLWRSGLLTTLLILAAFVAMTYGIAGTRFGWLKTAAIFSGGFGALAWVMFRHSRYALAVLVVTVTVGAAVTVALDRNTPMMPDALVAAFPSDVLPPGSALLETHTFGNPWCFDYCPSVMQVYEAPGETSQIARSVARRLRSREWSVDLPSQRQPGEFYAVSPERDVEAIILIGPASEPSPDSDETQPTPRPGYTIVEISIGETPEPTAATIGAIRHHRPKTSPATISVGDHSTS